MFVDILTVMVVILSYFIRSFLNALFNFTCYHPPPPPPSNPGDKSSPSVPGVGNCLKPTCPGGRGRGKSNITSCFSCDVRHFSVDAGPRGEDCLFPVRISRICSRLVGEEYNLSKLKSVFEGTFILNCETNVRSMRTRMDGVRHKTGWKVKFQ